MSRPDLKLTPEESARLKGQDWKVPPHALDAEDRGREVKRWSEVAVLTEFTLDQTEKGIQGRIGLLISDEDHHRNTNPRQRLTVWIRVNPEMAKASTPPERDSEEWGPYWGTVFAVRNLESILRAIGETGLLTNRRHLTDFGALYDFLNSTDLQGREVMVQLQYPPRREQVEPDVRYFEAAT